MAPWTKLPGGWKSRCWKKDQSKCMPPRLRQHVELEVPFGHDLGVGAVLLESSERGRDRLTEARVLLGGRDPGRDLPERRAGHLEHPLRLGHVVARGLDRGAV